MSKWIIQLEEEPGTGELLLPLSEEILESAGWKTGDVLEWIDNQDGSWTIRKKETKMKFTFIAEHESGEKVTHESTKDFLPDVLFDFELFLRGCGFCFDGNLDFVEEQPFETLDGAQDALNDLENYFNTITLNVNDSVEHTDQYFDIGRNR
jgi:hypothetical protein